MRQTLGTGMMAPLSLANNFLGNYYAGPSGAAIGALGISKALSDGLMNIRARQDYNAQQAQVQAEKDRARMEDMNQRQAVAQALNPYKAAESSGMGNRDMARRQALPDAQTQMSLYNIAEAKRKEQEAADYQKRAAFATSWAAKRGYVTDPTGEKFMAQVGYNPFEFEGVSDIIARAEEKDAQRKWQEDMKREGWTQAQILKGMGGAAPKRELFVDKDGQYFWVDEGQNIPKGLFPAKGSGMSVVTNPDGTVSVTTGGANAPGRRDPVLDKVWEDDLKRENEMLSGAESKEVMFNRASELLNSGLSIDAFTPVKMTYLKGAAAAGDETAKAQLAKYEEFKSHVSQLALAITSQMKGQQSDKELQFAKDVVNSDMNITDSASKEIFRIFQKSLNNLRARRSAKIKHRESGRPLSEFTWSVPSGADAPPEGFEELP